MLIWPHLCKTVPQHSVTVCGNICHMLRAMQVQFQLLLTSGIIWRSAVKSHPGWGGSLYPMNRTLVRPNNCYRWTQWQKKNFHLWWKSHTTSAVQLCPLYSVVTTLTTLSIPHWLLNSLLIFPKSTTTPAH